MRAGCTHEVSGTEGSVVRDDRSSDLDGSGEGVRSGQIHELYPNYLVKICIRIKISTFWQCTRPLISQLLASAMSSPLDNPALIPSHTATLVGVSKFII